MEKQEREISIKELFWRVIFGWRYLLIGVLGGTILITAFFYLKDMATYNQNKENQQVDTKIEKKAALTEEQKEQIQSAELLQKLVDDRIAYVNNSVKMNVNADEENVLVLTWYVDSEYQFNYAEDITKDYTGAVAAAYEEYVLNGELAQIISKKLELECVDKYLEELVSIQESSDNTIFSVEVIYPSQDVLYQMAEVIKQEIEQQTSGISQSIGKHSLQLLSENIITRTDAELADYQQDICNELIYYQSQLRSLKETMSSEQLEQFEFSIEGESVENNVVQNSKMEKPKLEIKHIVVGFIAGLFLSIVWVVCKMLFSAKLQGCEELEDIYNVRVLGVIQSPKRIASLDKLFLKLKNRNRKQMSMEATFDMIISNIEFICKKEESNAVYLTGTVIEKVAKEILEKMTSRLEEVGIEVVYGENICYEAESLRKMTDIGKVVIVEQTGISSYQEIEREIKLIVEQETKIIGGVVLNTIP